MSAMLVAYFLAEGPVVLSFVTYRNRVLRRGGLSGEKSEVASARSRFRVMCGVRAKYSEVTFVAGASGATHYNSVTGSLRGCVCVRIRWILAARTLRSSIKRLVWTFR